MMDETGDLLTRTKRFIASRYNAGASTEQIAIEAYQLTLADIEGDTKKVEAMEAAAYWREQAMKQVGLHRETGMAVRAVQKAVVER